MRLFGSGCSWRSTKLHVQCLRALRGVGGCNMAARLSGLEPRYLAFKYTWNFDDMDVHRMS